MSKRTMILTCLGLLIAFGLLGYYMISNKKVINVGLSYMEVSAYSMGLIVGTKADVKADIYLPFADFILKDRSKLTVKADINATSNFLMENETKNILQTDLKFDNGKEASYHKGGTTVWDTDYGTKIQVSGKLIGGNRVRLTINYSINEKPGLLGGQKKNEGKTTVTCKLGETVLLAAQSQISGNTRKLLSDLSAQAKASTPLSGAEVKANAKISAELKKSKDRLEIILLNPSLVHEDSPKAQ